MKRKMSTTCGTTNSRRTSSTKHFCGFPGLLFKNPRPPPPNSPVFWVGLPPILKTAPGICWERLPSVVMGYLLHAADMPEVVAITLATGCAMDAMKPKTLYTYCIAVTNLLRRLRSSYGMMTLADLGERH